MMMMTTMFCNSDANIENGDTCDETENENSGDIWNA